MQSRLPQPHTHTCTDLLTPVAFPEEPKCNLPVIQRHTCAALVICFLINRCLDDNRMSGFLSQHHRINTRFSQYSRTFTFSPIWYWNWRKTLPSSNMFMLFETIFFVICQKLSKHFHMNATFVNNDRQRVLQHGAFLLCFCAMKTKLRNSSRLLLFFQLFKTSKEYRTTDA